MGLNATGDGRATIITMPRGEAWRLIAKWSRGGCVSRLCIASGARGERRYNLTAAAAIAFAICSQLLDFL